MPDLLQTLDALSSEGMVRVVIDTPAGSAAKFKFDNELSCYRLSRLLPKGMVFPFSFGSIPRTLAEDGDPLDALVLCDASLVLGTLVNVKLIGVLRAQQTEHGKTLRNDRLLSVPVTEVNPVPFDDIEQLSDSGIRAVEHFFHAYNHAHGRAYDSLGRGNAAAALETLHGAQARYDRGR